MICNLRNCNGYPVVDYNGKKYLVDTGMPSGLTSFPTQMSAQEKIDEFGVSDVDGIMGIMELKKYKTVEFDKINGLAYFDEPLKYPIKNQLKINDFKVTVEFYENQLNAYMDTGAPRFMTNTRYLKGLSPIGNRLEHTNTGNYEINLYRDVISINGNNSEAILAELQKGMAGYDVFDMFFSIFALGIAYCGFDFTNDIMWYN